MKHAISFGLVLTFASLAAVAVAGDVDGVTTPPQPIVEVHESETILTFAGSAGPDEFRPDLGATVMLPPDASRADAIIVGGHAAGVVIEGSLMRLRGTPVAVVRVVKPGNDVITVAVRHDGSWSGLADERLASPSLLAGTPGRPVALAKSASAAVGGSYVIITAPEYESSVAPLADWKLRKGWPVITVTTDVTGNTIEGIRNWLIEAYETWNYPPEYILLVGDVDDVPVWYKEDTVTDFPYTLLDGDDWMPDAAVGRFSVSSASEAATIVAKTIAYERDPEMSQTSWFTRAVAVAGQSQSATPKHTVLYCNQQLETIGFDQAIPAWYFHSELFEYGNYIVSPFQNDTATGVPPDEGRDFVAQAIDEGCSMVMYRGWAYSSIGWAPPNFWTEHISGLTNGAMLPVVFSFVCLNNNFADDQCFGEAWIREGSPENPKGAVAFIGNGEHHSHTRFNDAMAISTFDRIVDPEITTLGGALIAGKLRFMEHFPGELTPLPEFSDEDDFNELSVEYYFYIYNLLGDPELNFHKSVPTSLTVSHVASLPVGANDFVVTVAEADGSTPLAGARIGLVQNGELLGAALTDDNGQARLVFRDGGTATTGTISVTVSHAGRLPHEAEVTVGQSPVFLSVTAVTTADAGENGINPGDTLALELTIGNSGSSDTGSADLVLTVSGPAVVNQGNASVPAIAAGATGAVDGDLSITVAADAVDGAVIYGQVAITRGVDTDISSFELTCHGPELVLSAVADTTDYVINLGETTPLTLTLVNNGSIDTEGGSLALDLVGPAGAVLQTTSMALPGIAAGAEAMVGPVDLQLASDLTDASSVTLLASVTTSEGYNQQTSYPVVIGRTDAGAPSGPDLHGYYAYDTADYLYPEQRPVFAWNEISTALGGVGTKLAFLGDNIVTDLVVDLPFTFRYYGADYDRIRISDNGWLSFEADNEFFNFYNWPIPSTHGNGALVAPFWDNLTPEPGSESGLDSDGVYVYDDVDNDQFIIEWSRMNFVYDANPAIHTFQAILRDPAAPATPTGDGEILFMYKQVADIDYMRMFATVGLESLDETDGLQLSFDSVRLTGIGPLGPGQAIRITTRAPVRVPLAVSSLKATPNGDLVRVSWTCNDERPVMGWRIYSRGPTGLEPLTTDLLAADARTATVASALGQVVVLEAVLPQGIVVSAGSATVNKSITAFALSEPRPNPMRGESSIAFAVPRAGQVKLRIFDVRGRLVRTLLDGQTDSGENRVIWQGRDDRGRRLADGVYFYRLEHAGNTLTRKLLLVH